VEGEHVPEDPAVTPSDPVVIYVGAPVALALISLGALWLRHRLRR
jgi:hypothetical protein